ncbi:ArnT family glycosyltransferase [Candidatus Omnitrophota bacterium]
MERLSEKNGNRPLSDNVIIWGLLIVFGFLYFGFLSNFYFGDDILYAKAVEKGDFSSMGLCHPHHLIYPILGYYFYATLRFFGFTGRAVAALQVMNAFFGVCGVLMFYISAVRFFRERSAALLSTLILGFAYGYWYFATSGESYPGANLFLICSFFAMHRFSLEQNLKTSVLLGAAAGMAVLFQQNNVFLLPILLGVFFLTNKVNFKKVLYLILSICVAGSLIGALYLYISLIVLRLDTVSKIYGWLLGYGKNFFFFHWINLVKAGYGQTRAFFGGHFIKGLVLKEMSAYSFLLLITSGLAFILLIISLLFGILSIKKLFRRNKNGMVLILAWMGVYLSFFIVFEPGNFRYYIMNIIPIAIWCGMSIDICRRSKGRYYAAIKTVLFALPLFLFIVNFFGSVIYQKDLKNNAEYAYAKFIYDKTTRDDLLLFPHVESNVHQQLDYFWNGSRDIEIFRYSLRDPERFNDTIRGYKRRGKDVFVIPENRKVSSGTFIRSFGKLTDYFSVEGEVMNDFLDRYKYHLKKEHQYRDDNAYNENYIYSIEDS